jgi:hypothetical protein
MILSETLSSAMSNSIDECEIDDDSDDLEERLNKLRNSPPSSRRDLSPSSSLSLPPPPPAPAQEEGHRAPPSAPASAPMQPPKSKKSMLQPEEDKKIEVQIPSRNGPLKVTSNRNNVSNIQMSDVVKAQRANGSWDIRHIEWMTTVSLDKIKNGLTAKSSDVALLETCWATCLVIAMLEEQFAANKNEWNLVEQKARKFVKRSLNAMKVTEDLFEDAKKYVKSNKLKVQ